MFPVRFMPSVSDLLGSAKASKEMSLEKEWYYERYLAASEFKVFAKGGKIKAKVRILFILSTAVAYAVWYLLLQQLSEDAKRAHLQRLTALERAEGVSKFILYPLAQPKLSPTFSANAAARQTNTTVPERAHTAPAAADRPSGPNPVASGSDNDPQGSGAPFSLLSKKIALTNIGYGSVIPTVTG